MTEHSIVGQNAAPTQRQTQKNRYALEPTRKKELEHHSDQGNGPDHEEERRRIETLLGLQQKWCVSSRDEDVDGRMVKAPQKPLKRANRPQVVDGRNANHRDQADAVNPN